MGVLTALNRKKRQGLQLFTGLVILGLIVLNILEEQNYGLDYIEILPNSIGEHQMVEIPRCNCKVNVERLSEDQGHEQYKYSETSCSRAAYARGYGQNIVGFSFYGDPRSEHHKSKKYYQGIVDNLKLMPKYYPGWIMR